MGHVEKKPFAPWSDRDHPDAQSDEDARWKWGITDNYVDGETVALGEEDPRVDGRAFLQQPDDPFAYVDGDDVRDPTTGEVHPAFIETLNQLGLTYADVSQSRAGVHAQYRGELPEGVKKAAWQLDDEPFGGNDELPSIEIYAGKRVCVATGEHVPGTPTEIREWDTNALRILLDDNDQLITPQENPVAARESVDLNDYEPSATRTDETTDDIRDLFAALERLDAREVADRTIVHAWNDNASTSSGYRAFHPIWGYNSNGTANIVDNQIWQDTGDEAGYGGPVVMALIAAEDLGHRNVSPRDASGELWWTGVEYLREMGYDIPEYEPGEGSKEAVSTLPLARLEALDTDEARRYAHRQDLDWPTTEEARDRLRDAVFQAMRAGQDVVIDGPTSLGKSFIVANTSWLNHADVTGEQPMVHLHPTQDARDEALETSQDANASCTRLRGRKEACPVAGGRYDPDVCEEIDEDRDPITIDGQPASAWLDTMCEGRGLPFSVAHAYLNEHHVQDRDELPCCENDTECPAAAQWNGVPYTEDGATAFDVIHATHEFAYVPGLRTGTNIVLDERPDFRAELSQDRIRRAVTAFLKEVNAETRTYEELVIAAKNGLTPNEHDKPLSDRYDDLRSALEAEPPREWYLEVDGAHTLAPALARAIWYAVNDDADRNRRYAATVQHDLPRFDDEAAGSNAGLFVSVVLDDEFTVEVVRSAPSFVATRSVIGMDAHPSMNLWKRNATPGMEKIDVLNTDERRLWRYFERGLQIVQVGDATRPLASGEYFDERGAETMLAHLRESYGERFSTSITASSVETELKSIMRDVGVDDPTTMHYGEEKSRNDFGGEDVGYLEGSIDPGDDYVMNLLAEAGLNATPETTHTEDGEKRAHGRGFVGPDADAAAELLASVREQHVAQAAGRYARNPDDPTDRAVVFVRTDAMPAGFADFQVPGVEWITSDRQRDVLCTLRDREHATAAELAAAAGVTREHARQTLKRLVENGVVACQEYAGAHGAHIYQALALDDSVERGVVNLNSTSNADVWGTYTFALEISEPSPAATEDKAGALLLADAITAEREENQRGLSAFEGD